jgi:hypothetical protein
MNSFQQSAAAVIDDRLNLVAQLCELERLREQVRKAEQARSPRVERRKRTRIRRLEPRIFANRSGNRRFVSPT